MAGTLRDDITHLAAIDRLPCSTGEREAAGWIAERLREAGARVEVDEELVHGGFYTPLGLLAGLGLAGGLAALRGRRAAGAAMGAAAAVSMYLDLAGGEGRWVRRLLPRGHTTNVVGELGDRDADTVLVVHAHHDAARTHAIFDQTVPRLLGDKLPWLLERMDRWPPLMGLVAAGPALVALGAASGARGLTRLGAGLSAGTAAVMAHMARQPVVPGANDNLTGVAVLLEVARRLGGAPPEGLRLILLSAGAEEANQEGMLAYARRHLADLPRAGTTFVCLDTLGSPELVLIEGEGFLKMFEYPEDAKRLVEDAAREAGVHLRRGLHFTFATDGLVPLRRGYRTASIGSVNAYMVPSNYHWPTDTADNVDYEQVAGATEIVLRVIRRLAR